MKIVLSGVETNNKGAELMLYAILQEIERKFPDAEVYIPYSQVLQGLEYVKTHVNLKYTPNSKLAYNKNIKRIFRYLHLPADILYQTNIIKGADWFIDGSGFLFTDQWNIDKKRISAWQSILSTVNSQGGQIVFLPQAFGPVEKANTKEILSILSRYASCIYARERISYKYLENCGVVDMTKVRIFTDFTSLVDGIFPKKYERLRGGICIIPNRRMIDRGMITLDNYLLLLSSIIEKAKESNKPVYLLNHEGKNDALLAYKCKERIGTDVEVVTGLNALEVKGLIASAYLVVTSRFHGLASALNSSVPALATSWSHKYEELYRDYALPNAVLPLDDIQQSVKMVQNLMSEKENKQMREHLAIQVPKIKSQTREMWNLIWNC